MVTHRSQCGCSRCRRSLDDDGGDGKSKKGNSVEEHGELRRLIKK